MSVGQLSIHNRFIDFPTAQLRRLSDSDGIGSELKIRCNDVS